MPAADTPVFDISASADLEVELVDLHEPDIDVLKRGANHRYHSFVPADSSFITSEKSPSPSKIRLQSMFYSKLLDDVSEGTHLHMPGRDLPVPEFFNLGGNQTRRDSLPMPPTTGNEDAVSISPSVSSSQDERQTTGESDGNPHFSRPPDTLSTASGLSGTVLSPRGNLSNSDAEEEEEEEPEDIEESIYEDINDICDNIEAEIAVEEPKDKEIANKKASFLSFLRSKKGKGKKEKEKEKETGPVAAPSKPPIGTSVTSRPQTPKGPRADEDTTTPSRAKLGGGGAATDLIPTYSSSGSEREDNNDSEDDRGSYDEMKPTNQGYLSDNYEDIGFDQAPPPVPAQRLDMMEDPAPQTLPNIKKGKMLLRGATLDQAPKLPAGLEDAMGEKRGKLKDKIGYSSATLPRKMKLGGGASKSVERKDSFGRKVETTAQSIFEDIPTKRANFRGSSFSLAEEAPPRAEAELSREVAALRGEVEQLRAKMAELSGAVELLQAQNRKLEQLCSGAGPRGGGRK